LVAKGFGIFPDYLLDSLKSMREDFVQPTDHAADHAVEESWLGLGTIQAV
jgi:hypothetical protein